MMSTADQPWLAVFPPDGGWFRPECVWLKFVRESLSRGECDVVRASWRQLNGADLPGVVEKFLQIFCVGTVGAPEFRVRCLATMRGMLATVDAASLLVQHDWRSGKALPDDVPRALVEAFNHYVNAWGLTSRGTRLDFQELGQLQELPRAYRALIDAAVPAEEGTAPAWLAVHRLLDYLLVASAPARDARAIAGSPANPIRARVLFDAVGAGQGVVQDVWAETQDVGPASWYVDPVSLGLTVLRQYFVDSLQLAWAACRSAKANPPPALRLTTAFPDRTLIDGPSAGALFACALYAAATQVELNTDASVSVALQLPPGRSLSEGQPITLKDIELTGVGGVANKLKAAIGDGLRTVVLTTAQRQEAIDKEWSPTRDGRSLTLKSAETLDDVFRELTGNARIERVLLDYSQACEQEWEETWTGANELGRELGLANYVPPRYAILRPERSAPIQRAMRRTHGPVGTDDDFQEVTGATEEEVLQTLMDLEKTGRFLCLSEGPGAGKTVFTRRLLGFVSSKAGRDALFDGRGCLAMRWEDGSYGRRWPKNLRNDLLAYDRFRSCCAKHGCDPDDVFDYALANARLVVILDSLDQANQEGRQAILAFLNDLLVDERARRGVRVVMTGRPYAIEKIREARLPAASWRFGKVLPFNPLQQFAYLRGPLAPDGESPEAWRNRVVVQGVTKPVLGLEAAGQPESNDDATELLRDKISHYDAVHELLGNPQSLAYVRRLALKRKGTLSFSTRSGLYHQVTNMLLREGIKRSAGRSATLEELELANAMLAAAAFQMLVRNPASHVANGERTISQLRERAEPRFKAILTRSRFRGRPEKAWAWLDRVSVLTNRTLLAAASELTLAWPDQRLMEYYAGLHLARNAEPGWSYREDHKIRCGDKHVRRHAADERWLESWRFAIEMPAGAREPRVLLASVAELYEPVTQPKLAEGKLPWLRPTELMYRAWCLLENLPAHERAQASPKLLAGGGRVLKAYRDEFARLLNGNERGSEVARQIMSEFVEVPEARGVVLALTDPQPIDLDAFLLGRTAVTRGQYALFDAAYLKVNEAAFKKYETQSLRQPAQFISWYDAWCMSRWMGGRLPTEAEWEYACAAGSRTNYCRIKWPSSAKGYRDLDTAKGLRLVADFGRGQDAGPREVGSMPHGNAFGLYDMHGGVWECCGSWYSDRGWYAKLRGGQSRNPPGPSEGPFRSLRGGSWGIDDPWRFRAASGYWIVLGFRFDSSGFRLALVRSAELSQEPG